MRGQSHICLGKYLVRHYLDHLPQSHKTAFLAGCLEPDRNPLTYLKGSFRAQWLRGHNYRNARRFMGRISRRLEEKQRLSLFDYYTLGKLIHYTADAFTCAHNDFFPTALTDHRAYEIALQEHFLTYLSQDPNVDLPMARSIMEVIGRFHREYEKMDADIHIDTHFALTACCCVMAILFLKPTM